MTGLVADGYSAPAYWIIKENGDDKAMLAYYGATGLKYINLMAENLPMLESLEENSVDYYEAMKSSYLQNRSKLKRCSYKPTPETAPDYDFDMDDEEFDD
jgi:ABC-type transporter lipoprotein component MlaA